MLDLERLRALHAVSTHGSVRAAAEVLHVTTSAVSQQVAKLERETGQVLLERNGRGVRLTDAAELLVGHAARILSLVQEAEADLEAHRGAAVGELALAAFPTALRGLVPTMLRLLAADHPDLRATVRELDPMESIPLVQRGDLDVAIVHDWSNAPQVVPDALAKTPICVDVFDLAVPAGHRFADRDSVAIKELGEDVWISSTPGSICFDWLTYTLRAEGIEPRIDHMVYEFATQLALIDQGIGTALIPRLGRGELPAGVRAVPLVPMLTRNLYATWRAEAARRPAIRAGLAALRAAAA